MLHMPHALSFISVARAPNFEIAVTAVEPAGKACLQLYADEANGSMQWKMTHWPRLCVKTADN